MTPAEIAAKLSPAQVRALRKYAAGAKSTTWRDVSHTEWRELRFMLALISHRSAGGSEVTPLGRAVLAELDGK